MKMPNEKNEGSGPALAPGTPCGQRDKDERDVQQHDASEAQRKGIWCGPSAEPRSVLTASTAMPFRTICAAKSAFARRVGSSRNARANSVRNALLSARKKKGMVSIHGEPMAKPSICGPLRPKNMNAVNEPR